MRECRMANERKRRSGEERLGGYVKGTGTARIGYGRYRRALKWGAPIGLGGVERAKASKGRGSKNSNRTTGQETKKRLRGKASKHVMVHTREKVKKGGGERAELLDDTSKGVKEGLGR